MRSGYTSDRTPVGKTLPRGGTAIQMPVPGSQSKEPRLRSGPRVLVFAAMLPGLQQTARECGYALAVHGSMQTDLDLVAVPWHDEATDAEALVEALRVHIDGVIYEYQDPTFEKNGATRSHGRRVWSIHTRECVTGTEPYLDISVMPRLETR